METTVEAMLYEQLDNGRVRCLLCAHHCVIARGKTGVCGVRLNQDGRLYSLVYGHTIAQHVDPIEKKPLYHFYPGSRSYSIATPGCDFNCAWCQNWEIAHLPKFGRLSPGRPATPSQIVAAAQDTYCRSIAYTYTEPTVFFEYTYDTARLAREHGIANVYVTNGYMSSEMLDLLIPYLDAANVDLKAFQKKTYQRLIGASLQPVLDNIQTMKARGVWVEVTTLVIPGVNDDADELRAIARFLAREVGPDTPWHLSRFFPAYRMTDHLPTPLRTLTEARAIGLAEGLQFIYLGNVGDESDTHCPDCDQLLIARRGYWIAGNWMEKGHCPSCGKAIPGVWDS